MKYLAAALLIVAMCAADADAARWHHKARRGRLFQGGPIARATFRPQPIFGGPRMIWRGDWVPAYMVR